MFGHRQSEHDTRYDQGFEWFEIMLRIFAAAMPSTTEAILRSQRRGRRPAADQLPRPFTMSAAFSPAGRRFAAQTSDFLFTPLREPAKAETHIAEIGALAKAAGREVGVFTACHVVCRETDGEAEATTGTMRRIWPTRKPSTSICRQAGSLRRDRSRRLSASKAALRRRHGIACGHRPPRTRGGGADRHARAGFAGNQPLLRQLQRRAAFFHRSRAAVAGTAGLRRPAEALAS